MTYNVFGGTLNLAQYSQSILTAAGNVANVYQLFLFLYLSIFFLSISTVL